MSFHVPELLRVAKGKMASTALDGNNGAFVIPPLVPGRTLWTIASDGEGWEHVSVSLMGQRTKTPTWAEMHYVCRIFWDDEYLVVQFHPRRSQHVNYHPGCLHMWRPVGVALPEPEARLVGPVPA